MDPAHREDDRYRPLRLLGEGGGGLVWLAEDRQRPGSRVALKELAPAHGQDPVRIEALRREFALLASFSHPGLVEVFDFEASPPTGRARFAMEWVRGMDFRSAVAREAPGVCLEWVAELLRLLGFLHDSGVLHGDLKPGNIRIRSRPKFGCRVVLLDFGLAWLAPHRETALSGPHAASLAYVAPERLEGAPLSPRADLFSLGAVLFEALYGRIPGPADGSDVAGKRFLVGSPLDIPPAPEGYPAGLREWLASVLHPDPLRRPASAREALERLNEDCGMRVPWSTPVLRAARLGSGEPQERAAELARLRELVRDRRARLVWLVAPPGFGKSRLLRRLEVEALLDGRAVARGWRVLEQVVGTRGRTPGRDACPQLVLLDDVDELPVVALERLERFLSAGDVPCMIVAATQPRPRRQALARMLAVAGRVAGTARVDLGPLDATALEEMARRAKGASVAPHRVRWLLQASGGSPAVAEAILIEEHWERQRSFGADDLVRLAPRWPLLSGDTRRWALGLALLTEASDEELVRLLGTDPASAAAAAEEASAAGLARRHGRGWRIGSYAFAEALRRSAAEAAPLARRAALLLEETAATGAPERAAGRLGELWAIAGAPERALPWACRAAEEALESSDPEGAVRHWRLALRVVGRSREVRYALRMRHGETCVRAGLHREAARAFGAAARLAREPRELARALARQAAALVHAGRFERGLLTAARAEALAREHADPALQTEIRRARGVALARLGREEEAIPLLEASRLEFEAAGAPPAERAALEHQIGACRLRLGDAQAEENFRRVLRAVGEGAGGGVPPEAIKARIGLAVLAARRGAHAAARRELDRAHALAIRSGHLALQEACLSKLAALALDTGHYDRAIAHAERACDWALRLSDTNALFVNRALLAEAWVRCGRPGEAVGLLRETLAERPSEVEPENLDYARMLLAHARIEAGEAARPEVRELLEGCLERARGRRGRRARFVALALELERRTMAEPPETLEPVARELAGMLESWAGPPEPELEIRARLALARAAAARGQTDAALLHVERAEARVREVGAPAFAAEAAAVAALVLQRAGRAAEAARKLQRGRRALDAASGRVADGTLRQRFLERPAFAALREPQGAPTQGQERARLLALYDMIRTLNSQADPESLVETMLEMAMRAVGAERGMVLLRDPAPGAPEDAFTVHALREIEDETVRDAEAFSRTVVAAAGRGESVLAVDAGSDARVRDLPSVSLHGIRSLMCVPLRSRGRIVGTVYLDTRTAARAFGHDDLRFIEAFADHAALALENARTRRELEASNAQLRRAAEARTEFASIVGASPAMQRVFDLIERFAHSRLPVLVRGESGTGKELVARALHFQGPRRRGPFLCENCAAIPESLLESELFGHVRGAFTGAERDRPGLLEQAHRGTLFLDEIGDMPLSMQARVLRAIETGEIRRVGEERARHVDVRIVAATHRNLEREVREGRFREDLLYRLQVLVVELPPLRERPGDIPLLVAHFLERIGRERGRAAPRVASDVLAAFERCSWPGNVRQLQNVLLRLALLAGEGPITLGVLESDATLRRTLLGEPEVAAPVFSLEAGEREVLRRALEASRGNRVHAARLLGISRATLYRKLERHGLARR